MALHRSLRKLEEAIQVRLTSGTHATVERAAELYREAISIPIEVRQTPSGRQTVKRSKAGEYPRMETEQGIQNVASESVRTPDGPIGAMGVRGTAGGIGPFERRISDIPGHFVPGGYYLAMLAGAPVDPNWDNSANGKRKGPQDIMKEHADELRRAFRDGVTVPAWEVPF